MSSVSSTLLMTTLTALGSVFSSLLATPLSPVISQFFPKALSLTRNALEGGDTTSTAHSHDRSPAWVRLSVLRLIGVVPWSGINIACGVTGVALFDCVLGAFIGTLPWTAVTCQVCAQAKTRPIQAYCCPYRSVTLCRLWRLRHRRRARTRSRLSFIRPPSSSSSPSSLLSL